MYAAVIEETAPADSPSPRPIVVSPNGARLSITMSAISESRLPLLCLGVDGVRVLQARHRDDGVAVGLGAQGEADDRPVDAGVRRDQEDVGRVEGVQPVELVDDRLVALEGGALEHRDVPAAAQDDVAQRDRVRRDQPAGAARDLHGERLGVAGAEGLEDAPALQRGHDQVDGRVEAAGTDLLVEVVEPLADLGGEVGEKCAHAVAVSFDEGTVRGRVAGRSGRRCGATAAAEAASRLVVREKSRWAARR